MASSRDRGVYQMINSRSHQKPPLPTSNVKPIQDDDNDYWTNNSESKHCSGSNKDSTTRGSYSSVYSGGSTISSKGSSLTGSVKKHIPSSSNDKPAVAVEKQLFAKLVSKAYGNRDRGEEPQFISGHSYYDDSSLASFGTSTLGSKSSRTHARTSSWCSGYSGDDNWSLYTYGSERTSKDDSGHHGSQPSKYQKQKREVRKRQEKKFIKQFISEMKEEREALVSQFREELEREHRRRDMIGNISKYLQKIFLPCFDSMIKFLTYAEVVISNMPLTIGAVGLSWVTQGTIWFKFMEENIDECTTVQFFSPQCTYPEFPGCFECDVTNPIYILAVSFHYFCHIVALICCLIFLAKCAIAWRVVADELSNPTTSTPCGVVCITLICVAAGRWTIGYYTVMITSFFHFILSLWFLYIAICKFRLYPDPGWFPNTVGLAYAAVKSWLYHPIVGLFYLGFTMAYLFSTFFVAIYRAYYNHKIAAPVCFISLSAPSITMYAMTIMAQPDQADEEMILNSPEYASNFNEIHRRIYLPVQHTMMVLSLIGFLSSIHCLWTRWPQFRLKEFSPAHIAFVFPILSHTNAVQAYRAGVDSFSNIPTGSPFKIILFSYWFTCLLFGTILNFVFTYNYIKRIPKWTKLDAAMLQKDEEPPPSPCHTIVHEMMLEESGAHECLNQTFTSPAVLQANEAGALMRVRRGTEEYSQYGPYVRTRQVPSLGFDLVLSDAELRQERAQLLDWVAKNKPRTRNRTLSIPEYFKLRGAARIQDGTGAYGTFESAQPGDGNIQEAQPYHQRSLTWAWGV